MSCSQGCQPVSPELPGCFSGRGDTRWGHRTAVLLALLPELCGSCLRSAPTSLAAIKRIKHSGLRLPLGRLGLPGSTRLGLVASPVALTLLGGLWLQLGTGRAPPSIPVPLPPGQRWQEVTRVTLTPTRRCCLGRVNGNSRADAVPGAGIGVGSGADPAR